MVFNELDAKKIKEASILIIDDQPVNIKVVEKILVQDGYSQVRGLTDPREGVKHYAQYGADVVLLDINMPELNGYQVMEQLNSTVTDTIPFVLVLTAQTDRESRIKALELGARDFLTKPFDRVELLTRIRNLLEVRLLQKILADENRALEQRVRERTHDIYATQLEIIRRLGRAAEYRDNETGLHIVRMSKTSTLLARALGLDDYHCELLLNASPMHDVGKIGIPDHILLKPGKLSDQEWEVMKRHVEIGAEILSGHDSELLQLASAIALCHHERWDGSGYPKGLRGEAIPLEARIVALADVFDALLSKRPYKERWSVDQATAYVRENSGTHFDPAVVCVFLENIKEVLAIHSQYADR